MTETSIWHEVRKFEIGRNFSNKLWNACRFIYPQLEQAGALDNQLPMDKSLFALEDKWILSRLQTTIKDATRMLEEYHFAELAGFLYRFVWDDAALSAPATWTDANKASDARKLVFVYPSRRVLHEVQMRRSRVATTLAWA